MSEVITNNLDLWSSIILNKSTVGRGSNGKQEAYGVKKLRKLILDLAVRGKLVPQDPNDEPASMLLGRIADEKERLIGNGKIRKQKELLEINEEEKSFDLPLGWEWTKLGHLMEMFNGRAFKSTEWGESGLPIIRIQNLNDPLATFNYFDGELAEQHQVEDGDFLISWSGTPGTSFGAFIWKRGPAALNQHINKCLIFHEDSNYEYLKLAVNSCMDHLISSAQGGVGLKHVTKGTLNNIVFGYPPLAEQHRIVAKVDELMALCDQLEQHQTDSIDAHQTLVETLLGTLTNVETAEELSQAWARIADHFDTLFTTEHSIEQLKQTTLQLAVMGKLVTQDPNDEPASVLLNEIAQTKNHLGKDGVKKKHTSTEKIIDKEMPFELPIGWGWAKADAFSRKITDGEHFRPPTQDEGVCFLSAKDIRENGVSLDDPLFISEETAKKALQRCNPEKGDILIVSRGATVGRMCTVDVEDVFCLLGSVILIKPLEPILSEYLKVVMKSPYAFEQLVSASGSTAQPAIYLRDLKKIEFPIAPLSEQQRIVDKVNELMALCAALKTRFSDAQSTQIHLADAIVEQAVA